MENFQVWIEGYAATGESETAKRLIINNEDTLWEGENFQVACENALLTLKWDMNYYDKKHNTYWSCRFFDNEIDAKHTFG